MSHQCIIDTILYDLHFLELQCALAILCCRAFDETKRELLAVESHKALLSDPHTAMLQAKLKLRTPYITPLNILQVSSLRRVALSSLLCPSCDHTLCQS